MELSGFFETKEWACRRHAHSVCPDFAREFRNAGALARTVFPPRRRFEIRSEEFALSENTKRIFVVEIFFGILVMLTILLISQ